MWTIWAKKLLAQALKSFPKCNKSPNLVTLIVAHKLFRNLSDRNFFRGKIGTQFRLEIATEV